MITGKNYKFWFCTGSQDLYGDECLRKVAEHSRIIVEELNKSGVLLLFYELPCFPARDQGTDASARHVYLSKAYDHESP